MHQSAVCVWWWNAFFSAVGVPVVGFWTECGDQQGREHGCGND